MRKYILLLAVLGCTVRVLLSNAEPVAAAECQKQVGNDIYVLPTSECQAVNTLSVISDSSAFACDVSGVSCVQIEQEPIAEGWRYIFSVNKLDLDSRGLAGSILPELGNLTNLEDLSLDENYLAGSIPPELGSLTNLQTLGLSHNQLTGSIPPELGSLTNLQGLLNLSYNQLTGNIPPELGNLTKLEQLYLQNNQLTGSIPPELGNLTNLQILSLGWLGSENKLTGSIPPELGNLTKLSVLGLENNQLTGSIPPELGNLTNLEALYLYSNQLTGNIPQELSSLTNVKYLNLFNNQLTGSIPPEFGSLTNVVIFRLDTNQLTGSIPMEFGNLTNAEHLYLYSNQLTGSIPAELGNLTNVKNLRMDDNQLTGSIPPELENLINLESLNMDDNQLSGPIPDFNVLPNLQELSLADNQDPLTNLTLCRTLGVDYSRWSGVSVYPPCTELEILDPACSGVTTCNGDFLQEVSNEVKLADANVLLRSNVERSGAVTDGVTLLLLRMIVEYHGFPEGGRYGSYEGMNVGENDEPVTLTLEPSDCRWGELMSRDETVSSCSSITVVPETMQYDAKVVYAAYRAPSNFPLDSATQSAKVTITATNSSGKVIDTVELDLFPPPVLLVHGVWSSPDAWQEGFGFEHSLRYEGFDVYLVDHREGNGIANGSFDPTLYSFPIERLILVNEYARERYRLQDIAISQVDVVGHSMGGLITRARVKYSQDTYQRLENYNKGDFHKIITIGTPHQGTPLADMLIENKCKSFLNPLTCRCIPGGPIGMCIPYCRRTILEESLEDFGKPIGPAIYGFQTGSPAIKNIGKTEVPSHAVVGIAPENSGVEIVLNWILKMSSVKMPDNSQATIDTILDENGNHDTIVPTVSQQGGSDQYQEFKDVVHTSETTSEAIFNYVHDLLLDEPPESNFSEWAGGSTYRAPYSCPPPVPGKLPLGEEYLSDAVITFAPSPGTRVLPGEHVQIRFDITGGSVQDKVLFSVDGQFHVIEGAPPYVFDYTVPDYKTGRIDIYAQTSSVSGPEIYAVESHLIVGLSEPPISISVSPTTLTLSRIGGTYPLRVIGEFPDGSQIDITSSVAGTTYTTQSGTENVIAITAEGIIEARGNGQETVLITNSGQTISAVATVSAHLAYTITASAGPGGNISPSGTITVNLGEDKTFTILPDTGYKVVDVLVDGSSFGPKSSYSFTNVIDNHTIKALFSIISGSGSFLRDDWRDAEKSPDNPDDDWMCWAAAAANILDWTGWDTPLFESEQDIFYAFQNYWTNEAGSMEYGWNWWFDGTEPSNWAQVDVPGGGNYWSDYNFFAYFYEDWAMWDFTSDQWSAGFGLMTTIEDYLNSDYGVTLAIYKETENVGHALSVWGYEYDEWGNYISIYVTDSDDYINDLKLLSVNLVDDLWYLGDDYSGWFIGGVQALDQNKEKIIPEPVTFILFGIGLLGIFTLLRRKLKNN